MIPRGGKSFLILHIGQLEGFVCREKQLKLGILHISPEDSLSSQGFLRSQSAPPGHAEPRGITMFVVL